MSTKVGFTLVELSIVVALCMIVATLVMVHGSYMNRFLVHEEIEKLALVCRYLQNSALTTNQEKTLAFDPINKTYSYDGVVERIARAVKFGVIDGAQGPPSNPCHPITKPITFKNNTITFYGNGIIQSGTVYLVSNDKHVMYALSNSVSQISHLRIYKYDGTWRYVT